MMREASSPASRACLHLDVRASASKHAADAGLSAREYLYDARQTARPRLADRPSSSFGRSFLREATRHSLGRRRLLHQLGAPRSKRARATWPSTCTSYEAWLEETRIMRNEKR